MIILITCETYWLLEQCGQSASWDRISYSAQNTVILPNFLVWKFFGKVQLSHSFRNHLKLCRNCAFQQNFYIRKLGEITVFYAVLGISYQADSRKISTINIDL